MRTGARPRPLLKQHMCSAWNARYTTTRLIFILRISADVTSTPITPSMASPCALSMIVRRIQVELRAQLDFKSVRIWLNEEGENGYQQCEWDCAVTCAPYLCVCSKGTNGVSFTRSDWSASSFHVYDHRHRQSSRGTEENAPTILK